ncbi:MAG: hypothetical protein AB7P18_06895 [Candidatus Binatia bacterium]
MRVRYSAAVSAKEKLTPELHTLLRHSKATLLILLTPQVFTRVKATLPKLEKELGAEQKTHPAIVIYFNDHTLTRRSRADRTPPDPTLLRVGFYQEKSRNVIPAKAGIQERGRQSWVNRLDARLRGHDGLALSCDWQTRKHCGVDEKPTPMS